MFEITWKHGLYALGSLLSYLIIGGIYRIYFHRLSHLPGPRLASLTYLYQSYYDLYPYQGRWLFQQIALHEQYGPIVRVGPDEIHVSDPKFYDTAFGTAKRKRDKSMLWYWFVGSETGIDGSAFGTLGHEQHAERRQAMNGFFSMKKVRELEDRVRVHVAKTKVILERAGEKGETTNLLFLMSAMTMDVISEYSFGKTAGLLETKDLGKGMREMFESGIKLHPFARQFRTFTVAMMRTMTMLAQHVSFMNAFLDFENMMDDLTKPPYELALSSSSSSKNEEVDAHSTSIIQSMVLNPHLSPEDRSYKRIKAEAGNLVGAGTETTARTLSVGLYYILSNPKVHSNLVNELRTKIPTSNSPIPSFAELSQLPYLTACIHESTRLAHGVAGRLVRIAPDEDLQCHGYTIPRGATFSMSHYIQHMDPEIFPEPEKFIPERYLGDHNREKTMRYLVPFGKGPRACLGMNLAWCEMYLTIAYLIGGLDLVLDEGTSDRDVEVVKEYFLGVFPEDSKGINVRVRG